MKDSDQKKDAGWEEDMNGWGDDDEFDKELALDCNS